jgi:hypothetical protein
LLFASSRSRSYCGNCKVWRDSFSDSSLGKYIIHCFVIKRSVGQWWIVQVSSLAVVIHICRNKLLDDTSGPVANPNPEVRSSGTEKHRVIYPSSRTSLRIRVRHRSGPRTNICLWAVEYHWTILQADTTRTSEKLVPIYQCTRRLFTDYVLRASNIACLFITFVRSL